MDISSTSFPPITPSGNGGEGSGTYTNLNPVPNTLGGISSGSTFLNTPITDVLDMLLYPYQAPSFTSFVIVGQSAVLEVGQAIVAGDKSFTWNTSNSSNIVNGSLTIIDITGGNKVIANELPASGAISISINEIIKTTSTSHIWTIRGTPTQGSNFSRNFTVNWRMPVWFGESPLSELLAGDVLNLRVKQLATGVSGTYNMQEGGYKWFVFPAVFNQPVEFKDTNTQFLVAMSPVVLDLVVTNEFGIEIPCKAYRSFNVMGGSISVGVN